MRWRGPLACEEGLETPDNLTLPTVCKLLIGTGYPRTLMLMAMP